MAAVGFDVKFGSESYHCFQTSAHLGIWTSTFYSFFMGEETET